jgi:hypothetical protein
MDLQFFFLGILPLLLFVVVDIKYGMKAGIVTAVVVALILGIWMYIKTGQVDPIAVFEIAFLIVLGAISVKLKNSKFFKFQPTIIGIMIALYIGYLQFFVEPILIHYRPMAVALRPEMEQLLMSPHMTTLFTIISLHLIPLFFIHALMCGYAALKLGNMAWIFTRILVYPMLIGVMLIDAAIYRP